MRNVNNEKTKLKVRLDYGTTGKKKNVIFLLVDTLRSDFLGSNGFVPSPSPTMDYLMKNGLCLKNMFSVGCPTQMAAPGIMSSSYPLDKGGYNNISNRENFFGEPFKKAGYKLYASWVSVLVTPSYGFFGGFDKIFKGGSIQNAITALNRVIEELLNYYKSGKMSFGECVNNVKDHYVDIIERVIDVCSENIENGRERIELRSTLIDYPDWNYDEIKRLTLIFRDAYKKDGEKLLSEFIADKMKHGLYGTAQRKNSAAMFDNFDYMQTRTEIVLGKLAPKLRSMERSLIIDGKQTINFPLMNIKESSAALHINNLIEWINKQTTAFFAYVHLEDVHPPCNFLSYDIGNADIEREWSELLNIAQQTNFPEAQNKTNFLRYVFSVKYVDNQIKKVVEYLEESGKIDDTIIVILSDHGTNSPGMPLRLDAHEAENYWDEFYHVPLTYFNNEITPFQLNGLFSNLDVMPTLYEMVGLSPPKSFKGSSFSEIGFSGRDYVIYENMGAGRCDFKLKPIFVCVRSKKHKLVYQINPPYGEMDGFVKEFYDLEADPKEFRNLYQEIGAEKQARKLTEIAKSRVREILDEVNESNL